MLHPGVLILDGTCRLLILSFTRAGSANTLDAYKALAKTAKTQSPANIAGGVFSESTEGNASSTPASASGTATGTAAPSSTSSVAGGR